MDVDEHEIIKGDLTAKSCFIWKIDSFSRLRVNLGKNIVSPNFDFYGVKWCISLFPNGDTEGENAIAIYLQCQDEFIYQLNIFCAISIVTNKNDRIHGVQFTHCFKGRSSYGWPCYLTRRLLMKNTQLCLPDDNLKICCTIRYAEMKDDIEIPISEHSENLKRTIRNGEFGDVTFKIDGGTIKAYKGILAAQSDVFDTMFRHKDMKENQNNEVDIVDSSRSVFEKMLNFIYTDVPPSYDDDAEDLLKLAEKYHLERLKCLCEQELYSNISHENAAYLLILADTYSAEQLKKITLEYIATHLNNVLKSEGFNDIETCNPKLAVELLREVNDQRKKKKT